MTATRKIKASTQAVDIAAIVLFGRPVEVIVCIEDVADETLDEMKLINCLSNVPASQREKHEEMKRYLAVEVHISSLKPRC